jgi:hypothetical protein
LSEPVLVKARRLSRHSSGRGAVFLDQPIFDLESRYTLEVVHIPCHNRILPDQGGCPNEHLFHANQLAATCQMGNNVSGCGDHPE